MELIATLLGGLGLFLVGIKALGANLQLLAGRRVRAAVARATRGPMSSAVTGTLLGGLTQSSNAVTFIVTSLVQAGVLTLRAAMPIVAFANVGTAGLVMLATVDIRLAVLWLVGVVGFMSAFNLDGGGQFRPALSAMMGLGLLFLGLDLMKAGASPLREMPLLQEILSATGTAFLPPLLVGAAVTLVAQSSSTVTILALTLHGAGLIGFEQTVLAVYGASLGSGLAVLLVSTPLAGSARRLALFQALVKAAGAALFLVFFVLEQVLGIPLVLAATRLLAEDAPHRVGWVFLSLQLASALVVWPFGDRLERLLSPLAPETQGEALSRPRYLYDRALEDPSSALELVEREQLRLTAGLPLLLDSVREEGAERAVPRRELIVAHAQVERRISAFLAEVRMRGAGRELLDRAVAQEARLGGLETLRETLGEFGDSLEAAARLPDAAALRPTLTRLAEALHLILLQLADLAESGAPEEGAVLRELTSDRSDMMDGLRRRMARAEPELPHAAQELLFRTTAQFERAVWLVRRQALLLASEEVRGTAA